MELTYLPRARADRLIGVARVVLALFTLLAASLDPDLSAGPLRRALTAVALVFAAYAILLAVLSTRTAISDRARLIVHIADFLLYSILIDLTQAPVVFFVFWIFCAMLRFGTRGAVITVGISIVASFVFTVAQESVRRPPGTMVLRFASITTISLMIIAFGEYERRLRGELSRIASWPQSHDSDRETLVRETLQAASALLQASVAAIYWEESEEPWVWFAKLDGAFSLVREGPELTSSFVSSEAGNATFLSNWRRGEASLRDDGRGARPSRQLLTSEARARLTLGDAVVSSCVRGDLVDGRAIFGFSRPVTIDDMTLSDVASRLVAARLDHAAASARMRDAAVGQERIRVARDLHDGLLQSLTGAALQLESVHRMIGNEDDDARRRLRNVQQLIETDQRELRSFITQLRPAPSQPRAVSLFARLDTLRGRFERQWNVSVSINVDPPDPALSESLAAEIYNIVNEAAANAAKHAGATHVNVDVNVSDDVVVITVKDDGHGFPFRGTYDLDTLDEMKRGPVTLKERVASLNGDLMLHSSPEGTRLEITLAL